MASTAVGAYVEWLQEVHHQESDWPICDICGEEIQQNDYYEDHHYNKWCDKCMDKHRVPLIGTATCKVCGYTLDSFEQKNILYSWGEYVCDECIHRKDLYDI